MQFYFASIMLNPPIQKHLKRLATSIKHTYYNCDIVFAVIVSCYQIQQQLVQFNNFILAQQDSLSLLMKRFQTFQFPHSSQELVNEKEKVYQNQSLLEYDSVNSSSKKSITLNPGFQPSPFNQKAIFSGIKNPQNNQQSSKKILSSQLIMDNQQRVKSNSLHEKNDKQSNKFEFLAFAQRQHREEKQKKPQQVKEKNERNLLQHQNRYIKQQMLQIKVRMEKYFSQLQNRDTVIFKKQKENEQLKKRVNQLQEKTRNLELQNGQMKVNYNFLHQKCLRYQKDEEYYSKQANKYSSLFEKCSHLQSILQQKDSYIQTILKSKTQEYNSLAQSKNQQIEVVNSRLQILEEENLKLIAQISKLQHQGKSQSREIDIDKFRNFGLEFENRINFFVDENGRLKNLIGQYEGEIQSLKIEKEFYQNTLKAYEQRDTLHKTSSKIQEQFQILRNQLEFQKQERDKSASKYELQILKLQNKINSKKIQQNDSLLDYYDKQRLHEALYLAMEQLQRLKAKLKSN